MTTVGQIQVSATVLSEPGRLSLRLAGTMMSILTVTVTVKPKTGRRPHSDQRCKAACRRHRRHGDSDSDVTAAGLTQPRRSVTVTGTDSDRRGGSNGPGVTRPGRHRDSDRLRH